MPSSHKQSFSLALRDDAAKQEYWACLALRECAGIGMRRMGALLGHFGSAYEAVRRLDEWPEAGLSASLAAGFRMEKWRPKAYVEWTAAKISSCGIVCWTDPEYPALLRAIPDAPPFLYFFGDISLLQNTAVAVVGMRSCSDEGLKAAVHITRGLARAGVTIVSGMAKGIDRAAHLAGLEGVGGSIGVLGAGIDVLYPPGNKDLYALMHEKGLLVSELPPGFGVDGRWFPIRNRIISGLSRAVIVVEAAVRSGSLNTAKHALEQNREVMAVPGPVTAASARGCQELVRRGAKPVFCADDVLRELVPYLAASVGQEVQARDLERFRVRCTQKDGEARPESASATALPDSFLPWRTAFGKKTAPFATSGRSPAAGKDAITTLDANEPEGDFIGLEGLEAEIYAALRKGPLHIDAMCRSLGHDARAVSSAAAMLEVQGCLIRLPGMVYTRARS